MLLKHQDALCVYCAWYACGCVCQHRGLTIIAKQTNKNSYSTFWYRYWLTKLKWEYFVYFQIQFLTFSLYISIWKRKDSFQFQIPMKGFLYFTLPWSSEQRLVFCELLQTKTGRNKATPFMLVLIGPQMEINLLWGLSRAIHCLSKPLVTQCFTITWHSILTNFCGVFFFLQEDENLMAHLMGAFFCFTCGVAYCFIHTWLSFKTSPLLSPPCMCFLRLSLASFAALTTALGILWFF